VEEPPLSNQIRSPSTVRRAARLAGIALAVLLAALLVAAGAVYGGSERKLSRRYDVAPAPLRIPADSAAIARGAHLFRSVGTCALCHGDDAGGVVYADMGAMGRIVGTNLTRGRGGVGDSLTDADWVRAIRHGVRRDGTSLIVMPSEVFTHFTDDDLGALVAYLKQVPPVDRELPRTGFGPAGRALLAAGKLNILVAPKTPRLASRPSVPPARTPQYGRYLADVSGCHGCHGYGLSGGRVAGPPGLPPASNLTPAGAIAGWSEGDFVRAMRTGRRPGGVPIDEFMPWRTLGRMTDDELHALWLYLRGVPAREFGNK
jgi:mono/diheme cytochrome c family protein